MKNQNKMCVSELHSGDTQIKMAVEPDYQAPEASRCQRCDTNFAH